MAESSLILIVDDEPNMRRVLGTMLENAGYRTLRCSNGEDAMQLVRAQDPDVVLTDLKMPGLDGLELLRLLRDGFPEIPVVLLTAHGTVELAVKAMKSGAHDFLTKPFDRQPVLDTIGKALGHAARQRLEFSGPADEDEEFGIVGKSAAIERLRQSVRKVADSTSNVLVCGETGTGKELVADALHQASNRAGAPLIKINCGALPDALVEAELFGFERGAFTGAEHAKPGRFELADGGTLFLDEVGELPLATQVTLLRVLQDGVVERVGGVRPATVDVRVIAATNRELAQDVQAGRFREDLFYRLRVVELRVPALRERPDDVPLLVEFFLDRLARRLERERPRLAPGVLETLAGRSWPGNVRELQNAIESAMLLAPGTELNLSDFGEPARREPAELGSLKQAARAAAAETERRMIRAALTATGGNVTRAAERLGLSRRGLQLKLKELGLRPDSDPGA